MLLTLLMCVYGFQVPGAAPNLEEQRARQMELLQEDAREAGKIYSKMMMEGMNADLLTQLGNEFIKAAKPVQAKRCFDQALKQKSDHPEALKGKTRSEERLAFLNGRMEEFTKRMTKEQNYQYGCRSAAILFHMGYTDQSLDLLEDLERQFGSVGEIASMERTFAEGNKLRYGLMRQTANEFGRNVQSGKLDPALIKLGELTFLGLGEIPFDPYIDLLKKQFPDKLDGARLKKVLNFLAPEEA